MTDEHRRRLQQLIEDKAAAAAGTVIVEASFAGAARINRAANILQDTCLIARRSENGGGRTYSDHALEQIATMAEGIPAYANHVAADLAFRPRDVRDMIGVHKNVRFDRARGRVLSDLHLTEHHAPWVFSLAERLGDQIGNSLVSKGLVRQSNDGEIVESISAVRSGDLVSDPASVVKGLWESRDHDSGRSIPVSGLTTVQNILRRQRGEVDVPAEAVQLAEARLTRSSEPAVENEAALCERLATAVKR